MAWRVGRLLTLMMAVLMSGPGCSSGGQNRRIFVTRAPFTGALGGLTGADAQCVSFATAAAIGGTWKAWLSDTATNAIDRMGDVGPWADMNGNRVFRDKAQLMGFPDRVPATDETLGSQANASYWTGTMLGGTRSTSNCGDWTGAGIDVSGTSGLAGTVADRWTDSGTVRCDATAHLLCFEQ